MHDAKHVKLGRAAKGGTELAVVNTAIASAEAAWKIANRALNTAIKTLKVVPPAEREAGIVVETVEELVDKLKNEAKVI